MDVIVYVTEDLNVAKKFGALEGQIGVCQVEGGSNTHCIIYCEESLRAMLTSLPGFVAYPRGTSPHITFSKTTRNEKLGTAQNAVNVLREYSFTVELRQMLVS